MKFYGVKKKLLCEKQMDFLLRDFILEGGEQLQQIVSKALFPLHFLKMHYATSWPHRSPR